MKKKKIILWIFIYRLLVHSFWYLPQPPIRCHTPLITLTIARLKYFFIFHLFIFHLFLPLRFTSLSAFNWKLSTLEKLNFLLTQMPWKKRRETKFSLYFFLLLSLCRHPQCSFFVSFPFSKKKNIFTNTLLLLLLNHSLMVSF